MSCVNQGFLSIFWMEFKDGKRPLRVHLLILWWAGIREHWSSTLILLNSSFVIIHPYNRMP